MQALLVRVGIDQQFGKWNAPVDPRTGRFVFVPIPERRPEDLRDAPGCVRRYGEVISVVESLFDESGTKPVGALAFPPRLLDQPMHLDPDFRELTYGDNGQRAVQLQRLVTGDLIGFYSGLRSVLHEDARLVYALTGLYVVDEIVPAGSVSDQREWYRNAHTRRTPREDDILVRAKPNVSGRLERCLPIGVWHQRAYRVRRDVLQQWGGLSVKNGYIQRSARLPSFLDPDRFRRWFEQQHVRLLRRSF